MIKDEGCDIVVVAAADAVGSLSRHHFLHLADKAACSITPESNRDVPTPTPSSPLIPKAYDRVAAWQIEGSKGKLTRRHLAMCTSLMSLQV